VFCPGKAWPAHSMWPVFLYEAQRGQRKVASAHRYTGEKRWCKYEHFKVKLFRESKTIFFSPFQIWRQHPVSFLRFTLAPFNRWLLHNIVLPCSLGVRSLISSRDWKIVVHHHLRECLCWGITVFLPLFLNWFNTVKLIRY